MPGAILAPSALSLDGVGCADLAGAAIPVPTNDCWALVGAIAPDSTGAIADPRPDSLAKTGLAFHAEDLVIFDHIHVVPRSRDLGAVISEQEIQVEVWNAHMTRAQTLDDITVEGPQGIEVTDHLGVPAHFAATRSEIFAVVVSPEGDPQIDNVVTWEFDGIAVGGTGLWVLGFRLIPFPFDPNMGQPVTETFGYLTNVITAYSGMEQRVQLREVPVGSISYAVTLSAPRDAQMASAILFGNQPRAFGVARWQFRGPLTVAATPDDLSIYCDTTDVPFAVGGLVMLWTDPYTWEVLTIEAVAADHVVVTSGLRNAWAATATTVVPMVVGRLSKDEGLTWESLSLVSQQLTFDVDAFTSPGYSGSPTTFLGADVLELNYDRVGGIEERLTRRFTLLDPKTGKRTPAEQSPSPVAIRPFTWTAYGRDEIADLLTFLDTRKGKAVPFWFPSFQRDLTLSEALLTDAAIASIEYVRYVQQMWGTTGARRQIALWRIGQGVMEFYQITDASDPADYLTESLSLDPVAVQDYPADTTAISFMKLCRLDSDLVTIEYFSGNVARATIRCHEIPMEAPV